MADLELNSIGNGDGNNYLLRDNTKIPLSGSNQISGSLIPATDNSYDLGDSTHAFQTINIGTRIKYNGTALYFTSTGNNAGMVLGYSALLPSKDSVWSLGSSTFSWDNLYIRNIYITGTSIACTDNTREMTYCSGTSQENGGSLIVVGKNASSNAGGVCLRPNNGTNWCYNWMHPDGTWTWNGTACQIISDQRFKQQISQIDDDLLTAWEDVELSQFKYNDAVEQKGNTARLHTGYVVQQIDDACKKHNVDVSKYGLYCHEVYQEETMEVEHDDGTKTVEVVRPASEHYSLRYTEALIVECAFLRRENNKLKQLLQNHEERLKALEK